MSSSTVPNTVNTDSFSSAPPNVKTFVNGVLTGIGAPINAVTEQSMLDWLANEQGGPNLPAFGKNQGNPLGVQTTGAGLAGAAGNVQGGINATVQTLLQPNYQSLVAAFRDGTSVSAINSQIVASPWNGAHYGGYKTFTAIANGTYSQAAQAAAMATPANKVNAPGGCGSKVGSNPAVPNNIVTIPHTSAGLTYCQAKALLGAMILSAGGVITVLGISTLLVGALGKSGAGKAVGRGAAPVIKIVQSTRRSSKSSPTPTVSEVEEAA